MQVSDTLTVTSNVLSSFPYFRKPLMREFFLYASCVKRERRWVKDSAPGDVPFEVKNLMVVERESPSHTGQKLLTLNLNIFTMVW